jgi:hypothetical protein
MNLTIRFNIVRFDEKNFDKIVVKIGGKIKRIKASTSGFKNKNRVIGRKVTLKNKSKMP